MTPEFLRTLTMTRKPTRWADVHSHATWGLLPLLPTYAAKDLGIEDAPLATFKIPVDEQFFIVSHGDALFLVNTEGYDYARYISRIKL